MNKRGNIVLVTGAGGQLGQDFRVLASDQPDLAFHFATREELDIANEEQIINFVKALKPAFIVNCAAYTNVEKAEEDCENNFAVNATAAGSLAKAAKAVDAILIHISTDYVFDGKKSTPYSEQDHTHPLNEYGRAKEAGEKNIQNSIEEYYIFRTSWLYSTFGHNFFKTMMRLSSERDKLTVVNDQFASPTYARRLAQDINRMIIRLKNGEEIPFGIYHYTHSGTASWFDFTCAIIEAAGRATQVEPVSSDMFPQKALRPSYSKLDTSKFEKNIGPTIHWKEALQECFKDLQS
jgi:dTDP-4-dehydrorhamnose reductase